ncbi:MAG TPA: hypothetical protein PKN99_02535 [Cyclobacteriaceae bacterium]|nr:hypothetical protein [Cyclobacteriaceae bacterium]HRK52710.1 hypothetical protein [Cyclobacteriaceae bacterium]
MKECCEPALEKEARWRKPARWFVYALIIVLLVLVVWDQHRL